VHPHQLELRCKVRSYAASHCACAYPWVREFVEWPGCQGRYRAMQWLEAFRGLDSCLGRPFELFPQSCVRIANSNFVARRRLRKRQRRRDKTTLASMVSLASLLKSADLLLLLVSDIHTNQPTVFLLILHPRQVYAIAFKFVRVKLYTIIWRLGSGLRRK